MYNSKLITLLKTFSKKEMKEFEKFIISPFFNKGRNYLQLYKALKPFHPAFNNPKLTESNLFKKTNPNQEYSNKKSSSFRSMLSRMNELAEKFMHYNNDIAGVQSKFSNVKFLKVISEKGLKNLYISYSRKVKNSFDNEIDHDSYSFLLHSEWRKETCRYLIVSDKQQEASDDLLKHGEYLTYYFLCEFLKLRGNMLTQINVFNADFGADLIQEVMNNINFKNILNFLKNNTSPYYPIIAIYYYSFMAQSELSNISNYQSFKKLFEENLHMFNHEEKYYLFNDLESCCWKNVNSGEISLERNNYFKKELFEIYKKELKEKIHKLNDTSYMRISHFRNILIAALNMREFEWLERFAKSYAKELAPEHSENMYNYSLAIVNFRKGKFEKSLKLMSSVKYEYFYLKIDVKNWILQNYYELNLFEHAYSFIDSYKHFLSKNKNVSKIFKKFNIDFLNLYVKLLNYKARDNSLSLESIKDEASCKVRFAHKGWFIKKIEELEKKNIEVTNYGKI